MGEVRCTIEIPQCYGFGSERLFQPGNISRAYEESRSKRRLSVFVWSQTLRTLTRRYKMLRRRSATQVHTPASQAMSDPTAKTRAEVIAAGRRKLFNRLESLLSQRKDDKIVSMITNYPYSKPYGVRTLLSLLALTQKDEIAAKDAQRDFRLWIEDHTEQRTAELGLPTPPQHPQEEECQQVYLDNWEHLYSVLGQNIARLRTDPARFPLERESVETVACALHDLCFCFHWPEELKDSIERTLKRRP